MSDKNISPEERAARGKRLLRYGMFVLVVTTWVAVFLSMYFITGPLTGSMGPALKTSLLVSGIALAACIVVWFLYTKLILKD